MSSVKDLVKAFVIDNFLYGKGEELNDDSSFLDEGIIDSTGVLELVGYLEETFGIAVADEELLPENLDSLTNIAAFVGKKFAQAA